MILTTTLLAVVVLLPAMAEPPADGPLCAAVCACSPADGGTIAADCSRVALAIVPPVDDWPRHVSALDLSYNNVTVVDVELAHDTLQVLDLSSNRISEVSQSAFGGLKKLVYLNLAHNNIQQFGENGFYGLEHLQSLNLSDNGLNALPDGIFYNFLGLRELSLSDNPLVHLDPIHMNRMVLLQWLDLSNIEAYSLQPNIFHTTLQLQFIDLSSNQFHAVPTDALRSAQMLKTLRLSENPVDVIDGKSFLGLNTLESLQLNSMDNLKTVAEGSFAPLVNLRSLEMNYNRYLSSVHALAFDGLFNTSRPLLQELGLEGNLLRTLDAGMVDCSRMRKFNVQNNPLDCDCRLKWIKRCHIQMMFEADLKCNSPVKLSNRLVSSLSEKDFVCTNFPHQPFAQDISHQEHVVRSITIGMVTGFLVVLAFGIGVILKWKHIKSWYRYNRKGPGAVYYVKARSNPRDI